jgi:LPS sulfotransferase NodH
MMHATSQHQHQADPSIELMLNQSIKRMERGDLKGAERGFAQVLARHPDNAYALNGLGVLAGRAGRTIEAVARFRAAVAADPALTLAQENLANGLAMLAEQKSGAGKLLDAWSLLSEAAKYVGSGAGLSDSISIAACNLGDKLSAADHRESIEAIRCAIALAPYRVGASVNLELLLSRFGEKAKLSDYAPELKPEQLGRMLLIACFPKSGSTLLKRLLLAATGFGEASFVFAYRENEQEIYLPYLRGSATRNLVIQQHCLPTSPNQHLVQAFGIRPIILVRNILDVLLSWKEFLDQGAYGNTFYPQYTTLSDQQRLELVIDDRASWYLSFFAGWQRAVTSGQIEGFWLTYGELTADPRGSIEAILKFQGIVPDPVRVEAAAQEMENARGQTRFNKGVIGRGLSAFSEAHVAQIRRIAAYHPDVDFSRIGL